MGVSGLSLDLPYKPSRLGDGSKIGNSRKWLRVGGKGLWDPRSKGLSRVCCTFRNLFSPVQEAFLHRCNPIFAPVQEAFCSLGPEDLLHPLITTFGNFLFSTPLSQAAWFARFARGNRQKGMSLTTHTPLIEVAHFHPLN